VTTPVGTITSDDQIVSCSNQYRDFVPTMASTSRFSNGVLNDFLVVAGGYSPAHPSFGLSTIQVLPLPRCSGPAPTFTTLSTTLPAAAGKFWAGSTVANNGLYIIGGVSGGACTSSVVRFDYSGGPTGAFTTEAPLPTALCSPTAVTLFDSTTNHEYILVTGGTVRLVPRVPISPAYSAADIAPRASYVYDVQNNTWATFSAATQGLARYNMAGAGYHDAVASNNVAVFVGGQATVTTGDDPAVTTANAAILSNGVPFFFANSSLPVVRSEAAIAVGLGKFWLYGGATTGRPTASGIHSLYSISATGAAGGDAWTTVSPPAGGGRHGHAFVLSNFNEPVFNDLQRFLAIGGNDGGTMITSAREYIP
jgi:hypothetical protein